MILFILSKIIFKVFNLMDSSILDKINNEQLLLSNKSSHFELIDNPWYAVIKDRTIEFPILNKTQWYSAWHKFNHTNYLGSCFMQPMVSNRKESNDAIYELPTYESIKLLTNILKNSKVLSTFCGVGLYDYCLKNNGINIISTDNYSSHHTKNLESRYTDIDEVSFKEALRKYPNTDTLLCVWAPMGFSIMDTVKKYKNIKQVILVGEPVLCGKSEYYDNCESSCESDDGYELVRNNYWYTSEYIGEGGVSQTDASWKSGGSMEHSHIYKLTRI
jgi:hypothetical protein